MADIDLVGFDMDYTLALYNQRNLEELSIQCTLTKMIEKRGYSEELRGLTYDPKFAVRGLVVDRQLGNVFKMDRFGYVGRVYHGKTLLGKDDRHRLYRTQRIRVSHPRYALIDTLFALPEAVLFATIIEHLESKSGPVPFNTLWQDIRDCIDEAHRDETMKRVIKAHPAAYIERDPELAATLHKLRSSGKRLFLLTNSAWDYTDVVMKPPARRDAAVDTAIVAAIFRYRHRVGAEAGVLHREGGVRQFRCRRRQSASRRGHAAGPQSDLSRRLHCRVRSAGRLCR